MKKPSIRRAKIIDGWAVCPKCGSKLCRVYYGAEAHGVELWCGNKSCKLPVLLELKREK